MLTKLFRQSGIPIEYRSNFLHLYLDIGWFGVLSGSAINFLNIYAIRIGATGLQIGLIGAMSAVVSLFLAIPAGRWLQTQHTGRAIFWTSVFYRLGFLPLIFLPSLFPEQTQVWAIIIMTFLMAIPLTPLGVGFNALFAEAVPDEYRAHVAGIRNIVLSIAFMGTSLLSGYLLDQVAFPIGYQIVFGIGFFGAAMSSLHIFFIRPLQTNTPSDLSQPQAASIKPGASPLRLDIWQTRFRNILLGLFAYHLAQYLALPVFPLYNVHILKLNDNHIGIGTAIFYLTVLLGSTQLHRLVHRLGNKKVTGLGVAGMASYPFILAFSHQVWQYYAVSFLGGFVWALAGGAFANYMLEHIPPHDRPSHLAWYNIILNAAVLIGSLGGPVIADIMGLSSALILFAVLRLFSGIFILKWG
jgi:MFS family permease